MAFTLGFSWKWRKVTAVVENAERSARQLGHCRVESAVCVLHREQVTIPDLFDSFYHCTINIVVKSKGAYYWYAPFDTGS
jgi:hypothetical protein